MGLAIDPVAPRIAIVMDRVVPRCSFLRSTSCCFLTALCKKLAACGESTWSPRTMGAGWALANTSCRFITGVGLLGPALAALTRTGPEAGLVAAVSSMLPGGDGDRLRVAGEAVAGRRSEAPDAADVCVVKKLDGLLEGLAVNNRPLDG